MKQTISGKIEHYDRCKKGIKIILSIVRLEDVEQIDDWAGEGQDLDITLEENSIQTKLGGVDLVDVSRAVEKKIRKENK